MALYLIDTETQKRYSIPYADPEPNIGGINASYQNAQISMAVRPQRYWLGSDSPPQSFVGYFFNSVDKKVNIRQQIEELELLCEPNKGKVAPPIVGLKFMSFPLIQIHLISVIPEYDFFPAWRPNKNILESDGISKAKVTVSFIRIQTNYPGLFTQFRDTVVTNIANTLSGR